MAPRRGLFRGRLGTGVAGGWAERGLEAFPDRPDPRLREFLADQYHSRRRHDDAMALIWCSFAGAPSLPVYHSLEQHVERAGQWPAFHERAMAHLRERIARSSEKTDEEGWGWRRPGHNDTLVAILLWEKDAEAAWQAANESGCSDELWMQLADLRAKAPPPPPCRSTRKPSSRPWGERTERLTARPCV